MPRIVGAASVRLARRKAKPRGTTQRGEPRRISWSVVVEWRAWHDVEKQEVMRLYSYSQSYRLPEDLRGHAMPMDVFRLGVACWPSWRGRSWGARCGGAFRSGWTAGVVMQPLAEGTHRSQRTSQRQSTIALRGRERGTFRSPTARRARQQQRSEARPRRTSHDLRQTNLASQIVRRYKRGNTHTIPALPQM